MNNNKPFKTVVSRICLMLVFALPVFIIAQSQGTHTPAPISLHSADESHYSADLILDQSLLSNIDAVQISFPADSFAFANGVYPLDSGNCMQLPILGQVCLDGQSMGEVSKYIESAYSAYISYPFVRIKLLMRIGLLGGFFRPGHYYVDPSLPLWSVVAMGGGLKREDGYKKMKWRRNEKVMLNNLTEAIITGKTLKDLNFQSGDYITVVDKPKLGFWTTLRTEVFPFLALLASLTYTYAFWTRYR